ncbi:universal stress protein [Haloarcula pelagica]|uniref:universal stress protein n=1 Tax=Haloarcula pelagica TaxID=3033389 RepID=UPI0024C2522D|nr:universal stress protein [Halomicroarcula sp. YJ-61-S]
MYETILYPTDGSEGAEAALAHARDHAQRYGAEVHVLFVADSSFERSGMVGEEHAGTPSGMRGEEHDHEPSGLIAEDTDPLGTIEAGGEAIVERVAAAFGDDVPVTTAVRRATPYNGIIEYAEGVGADLIVMGTHGRRGVDHFLIGSVAEKVVRTSEVPVLTVRLDDA